MRGGEKGRRSPWWRPLDGPTLGRAFFPVSSRLPAVLDQTGLGSDCRLLGGPSHWHGRHRPPLLGLRRAQALPPALATTDLTSRARGYIDATARTDEYFQHPRQHPPRFVSWSVPVQRFLCETASCAASIPMPPPFSSTASQPSPLACFEWSTSTLQPAPVALSHPRSLRS